MRVRERSGVCENFAPPMNKLPAVPASRRRPDASTQVRGELSAFLAEVPLAVPPRSARRWEHRRQEATLARLLLSSKTTQTLTTSPH
jgi:hypothetical protein